MGVDMFLKIDDVAGGSVVTGREGWIDVISWNWGMTQTGTMHEASGGGAGKVNVQDLTFTHNIDPSTPRFIESCCTGKHYGVAQLAIRKAGGTALEYLSIKMEEVLVSGVSSGGSGGGDIVTENVTLNFARFTVDYTPQTGKGAGGAKITGTYDIAKGPK